MANYDYLVDRAAAYGLRVMEIDFESNGKGLIKGNKIGIRRGMRRVEKVCALAEEIGHYHTGVGDILDQADVRNRKQELRARQWAYNYLIPLRHIVDAYHAHAKGRYEIAKYLGVTEAFLQAAIDRYTERYGLFVVVDERYTIMFDPLDVVERFVD